MSDSWILSPEHSGTGTVWHGTFEDPKLKILSVFDGIGLGDRGRYASYLAAESFKDYSFFQGDSFWDRKQPKEKSCQEKESKEEKKSHLLRMTEIIIRV